MKLTRIYLLFLLICGVSLQVAAQDSTVRFNPVDTIGLPPTTVLTDTAAPVKDSIRIRKKFQPDAKRAGLYAALIPGMGQLYNRQYWKMPIVYAVMGVPLYFAIKRNDEYNRYRSAYISRLTKGNSSTDEFQGILTETAIKQYQDEAKQSRDMMIVYTVIGYTAQILEAISGAHLKNFDISKDLSMQVSPLVLPHQTIGFGLVMNFKR